MAEKWVNMNTHFIKGSVSFDRATETYLAGFKAGRLKWHKVADGDLPKESGDYITNIGVLTYDKYGNDFRKWITPICEACDYEDNVRDEVIAWCEMPIFEKG